MLNVDYSALFQSVPPEVATMLIAMLPIAELRVALPLALTTFQLSPISAIFWSIVGNLIPVVVLLYILEPVSNWLQVHSRIGTKFFTWMANRTKRKFEKKSVRYGLFIALMLFVAVPLPVTGGWTGALVAYLFGIKPKRAFPAIALGVGIASIIVYVITQGIISLT